MEGARGALASRSEGCFACNCPTRGVALETRLRKGKQIYNWHSLPAAYGRRVVTLTRYWTANDRGKLSSKVALHSRLRACKTPTRWCLTHVFRETFTGMAV